jgi:predicted nucleotidyltransferase component of viral defense system
MLEKSLSKHYHSLYQFQDRVLSLIDQSGLDFYLGGGTALGRFYLNHRYSEDLDFFSGHEPDFIEHIQQISEYLMGNGFKVDTFGMSQVFTRFHIEDSQNHPGVILKTDFINERNAPHFGDFKSTELFSKVDNLRNILSGKVSFIYKKSPKDIADIWCICKNLSFRWDELIHEASQKRAMEPLFVVENLRDFPSQELDQIAWITPINIETFENDRKIIIQNIITKSENELFSGD